MIPERIINSLDRYVNHGIPTGGFLRAFLAKDLTAISLADNENRIALWEIWLYCYNEIPSLCWGSYKAVDAWIEMKTQERNADSKADASESNNTSQDKKGN